MILFCGGNGEGRLVCRPWCMHFGDNVAVIEGTSTKNMSMRRNKHWQTTQRLERNKGG